MYLWLQPNGYRVDVCLFSRIVIDTGKSLFMLKGHKLNLFKGHLLFTSLQSPLRYSLA